MKVIFIHGNGGCTASHHWYKAVARELKQQGLEVVLEDFPDNQVAHETIWLDFLENQLGADQHSILVGHSSGAVAAMRYAENHKLLGSVLVAACHTDLGDPTEKESGYYSRPWNWEAIRSNQQWIIQFASVDDHCIPIEEARYVRDRLQPEYHEYTHRGHFMGGDPGGKGFPELVGALLQKIQLSA